MGIRLEVIEFHDDADRSLAYRVPQQGSADIKAGAQLIVQQNQMAVFYRDGKALDTFGPGRHTLTTANVPILTRLLTIPWEKSPFQCQVYYFSMKKFRNQKWGTPQPILYSAPEFPKGIYIRGFGQFSYRLVDLPLFLQNYVGTKAAVSIDEATADLKGRVVAKLRDVLGTLGLSATDLAAKNDELQAATRAKLAEDFAADGLELSEFFITALDLPEEVKAKLIEAHAMHELGDLNQYMKYQAANSMAKLAEQGGGTLGAGAMGMGMGAGFGFMMPQMMQQAFAQGTMPPGGGPPARGAPVKGGGSPAAPSGAAAAGAGLMAAGGGPSFDDLAAEIAQAKVDPRAVVRSVVEAAGYPMEAEGDELRVTVPINELRKQIVTIVFGRRDGNGGEMVTYHSTCGPASERNAMALLRYNTKLMHGAFAVQDVDGRPMVVVQCNQLADTLDAMEVSRALTALAWQADKVEQKLMGDEDTF